MFVGSAGFRPANQFGETEALRNVVNGGSGEKGGTGIKNESHSAICRSIIPYPPHINTILLIFDMVCITLIFAMEFIFKTLFLCDRRTVLTGGDKVEFWPSKLATAKFLLKDMKLVKKTIPNTISPKL
ncbi:O-acyltransferase WSD1-like protein [Corchorus olitorius]|uniref:O-acyltransferase WSD1-like protein n=1 Tax=Corchorus olitorius TaxID=93759 RepID=A0A1R3KSE6_9ROSI|nr:O-acyltransferase WSD1-like protein [Corchorus olitorius]